MPKIVPVDVPTAIDDAELRLDDTRAVLRMVAALSELVSYQQEPDADVAMEVFGGLRVLAMRANADLQAVGQCLRSARKLVPMER